jgi:hypothetical protein
MGVKSVLFYGGLAVVGYLGYIAYDAGYKPINNAKIYEPIGMQVTKTEASLIDEFKAACAEGSKREGNRFYTGPQFQSLVQTQISKMRQQVQTISTTAGVPETFSAMHADAKNYMESEIKYMEELLAYSKSGQINAIMAADKSHAERVKAHFALRVNNFGKTVGWGR